MGEPRNAALTPSNELKHNENTAIDRGKSSDHLENPGSGGLGVRPCTIWACRLKPLDAPCAAVIPWNMKITNVSPKASLFLRHQASPAPSDPSGTSAILIRPGESLDQAPDGDLPLATVHLFRNASDAASAPRELFWKGAVDASAPIEANPDTGTVTWGSEYIDQSFFEQAKKLFGDDPEFKGITLQDLAQHAARSDPRGRVSSRPAADGAGPAALDATFTDCELNVAQVVLDAVLLALGAGALIETLASPEVKRAIAGVLGKPAIAELASQIPWTQMTGPQAAGSIIAIIDVVGPKTLPLIVKAAVSNLSTFDKFLWGSLLTLRLGAVAASLALTGGLAAAAWGPIIAIEFGISSIFVIKDVVACYDTCTGLPGNAPVVAPEGPGGSFILDHDQRRITLTQLQNGLVISKPNDKALTDRWELLPVPDAQGFVQIQSRFVTQAPGPYQGKSIIVTIASPPDPGGRLSVMVTGDPKSSPYLNFKVQAYPLPAPGNDKPFAPTGYVLLNWDGSMAVYAGNGQNIVMKPFTPPTPAAPPGTKYQPNSLSDPGFLWQDVKPNADAETEAMDVGWELEFTDGKFEWGFWNSDDQYAAKKLRSQAGVLTRTDDPGYWSVVAMGRWNGGSQAIAQVRCWTDAAGPHVQAGFNARNKHFPVGASGAQFSVVEEPDILPGMKFKAWLIN
jgi:hypothetical protein